MRIVALSDTHGYHDEVDVPDGDILIFAGDMCGHSTIDSVEEFGYWMDTLPHEHKIYIAGNHDWPFVNQKERAKNRVNAIYLEDGFTIINGIKIYGSPWTPEFCGWAFMKLRGNDIKAKWDLIPEDTDILVTHGPPMNFMDDVRGEHCGCRDLKDAVERVMPQHHCYGHIHESYGSDQCGVTQLHNVSICDGVYDPRNAPVVFDVSEKEVYR